VILLVRNGVEHDARVWRAARVARQLGPVLILGAGTDSAPAGRSQSDGITVIRLPTMGRPLRALRGIARITNDGVDPVTAARRGSASARGGLSMRARLRRALVGASWTVRAVTVTVANRPAIVHANDWNTMWVGVVSKLITGCALVYDSHELWADRNGRWEWRPWVIACEWLFVRYADAVLTTSPGHARALADRYRVSPPTVVRNLSERLGVRSRQDVAPTLAYVGGLMPGRGLEQALDALALVPGTRLSAVGPGLRTYRELLADRATKLGVSDRFEICGPVPAAHVVDELAQATVGLCLIQPICRSYELCLPNKLFEYVAAGLPVLCSDLPVIARVVRENGLGEVVPADNVAAIAAGIRALLRDNGGVAARAKVFASANLWDSESPILAGIYAQLAAGGPSSRP
jgi:glycosyltransferase involved in cell wall biosynthesis